MLPRFHTMLHVLLAVPHLAASALKTLSGFSPSHAILRQCSRPALSA